MIRLLSIFLLVFFLHGTASGMDVNTWLKLTDIEQIIYLLGVVDSWYTEVEVCKHMGPNSCGMHYKANLEPLTSCLRGIVYSQFLAIVKKDVQDHPEEWDKSLASYAWVAAKNACDKRK